MLRLTSLAQRIALRQTRLPHPLLLATTSFRQAATTVCAQRREFGTYWAPKLDPDQDWKNPKNRNFYVESNPLRTSKRMQNSGIFRWRHFLYLIAAFCAYPLFRELILAEEKETKTAEKETPKKKSKKEMTPEERELEADRANRQFIQHLHGLKDLVTLSPDRFTEVPATMKQYQGDRCILHLTKIDTSDFRTLSLYELSTRDGKNVQLISINPSVSTSADFIIPKELMDSVLVNGKVRIRGPILTTRFNIQSNDSYLIIGEGDQGSAAVHQIFSEHRSVANLRKCTIHSAILYEDVNKSALRDSIGQLQQREEGSRRHLSNQFVAKKAEDYQFEAVGLHKVHRSLETVIEKIVPSQIDRVLIIGKHEMIKGTKNTLASLGYKDEQIHTIPL